MAARKGKRLNVEAASELVRLHLVRLKAEAARLDGISVEYAGRLLGMGRLSFDERAMLADVLQARRWMAERRRRLGRRTMVWRPPSAKDDEALVEGFGGFGVPGNESGEDGTMSAAGRLSRN